MLDARNSRYAQIPLDLCCRRPGLRPGFRQVRGFFISSPNLSGRKLDVYHTSTQWCGFSAKECRSETWCARLAENTGRKKVTKNRQGTIAQICWAISSQLRHVSTIGKNLLSSNISSTCPHNMANFGPLAAEIVSLVWGTPGNFNGFRVLAVLLHGCLVVGVSQTLRRWTKGATYIRQGGHLVGHWSTFLVCGCHCIYWVKGFRYSVLYMRAYVTVLSVCCLQLYHERLRYGDDIGNTVASSPQSNALVAVSRGMRAVRLLPQNHSMLHWACRLTDS